MIDRNRSFLAIASFLLFFIACGGTPSLSANQPPAKGSRLPPIKLPIPKDRGEKEYLGLAGNGFFSISQIKTQIVIIEIFTIYCRPCQKIAPGIEELYQMIENDIELKDRIKLIGIGAGNSRSEVEVFKKTFHTPFPLFPDNDFEIHEVLGDVRTPYFIAIKIKKDGTHTVIHSELDSFKDAKTFLELMIKESGLPVDYPESKGPKKD